MSVQLESKPADPAKRAYVLLKAVEELDRVRGGIVNAYGAQQVNQLLSAAQQLAAETPDAFESLLRLHELNVQSPLSVFGAQRLAVDAGVLLAELKGMLRAFVDLHMEPEEKRRLGLQ